MLGGDGEHRASVAKGCPQGGVLSPLLWNVVVNDLITTLNNNHYYTVGYADDIVILTRGNHAGTVLDVTRSALAIVERWCAANELALLLQFKSYALVGEAIAKRSYRLSSPLLPDMSLPSS